MIWIINCHDITILFISLYLTISQSNDAMGVF